LRHAGGQPRIPNEIPNVCHVFCFYGFQLMAF
jgi:hypothetical protein